ncbi:MAG TPA: PqqD family peptide modification chaperone [Pyrinomonadaceae bacterium]
MYDASAFGGSFEMTTPPTNYELDGRRYRAIKEHLFSQLNEEGVILSLKNGKYYGLNSVGVSVWVNLLEGATLGEIEAAVMKEYDVDQATCRREVSLFLREMLNEKLIETIDDADR